MLFEPANKVETSSITVLFNNVELNGLKNKHFGVCGSLRVHLGQQMPIK